MLRIVRMSMKRPMGSRFTTLYSSPSSRILHSYILSSLIPADYTIPDDAIPAGHECLKDALEQTPERKTRVGTRLVGASLSF
jgi:hypothetical protein